MQPMFMLGWAIALCARFVLGENSTYYNPVLSGWHSDPSCVHVNRTFFCATSSFLTFPGIPIYASDDLIRWRLISHAWSRDSQLPSISWNTTATQGGHYAPTLRYHNGEFYVASVYVVSTVDVDVFGVVFRSTDLFDVGGWSDPVRFETSWRIDPDLFWDDDDTLYVATSGIFLQTLDLDTGTVGNSISIWNGTGGESPEGPHIYKKDSWYYLMIAEGGTALDHAVTIARSKNVTGPYTSYDQNPVLTNRGSDEYFQTVGHADLFQDANRNWWGMCLATRSGPEYEVYPMGREAVLFPVTWEEGEWPVMEPVRGIMSGWKLPSNTTSVGLLNSDPDNYHFDADIEVPLHFIYPRVPPKAVAMTANGMQIIPTRSNLTGARDGRVELTGQHGIGFIGRPQTHTLFEFSVDLLFTPQAVQEEAGVSIFLTQYDHIGLGVAFLDNYIDTNCTKYYRCRRDGGPRMYFRFQIQSSANDTVSRLTLVPEDWVTHAIRLEIIASNTTYTLYASSVLGTDRRIQVGQAPASTVSGGSGSFVGSVIGGFATCNGAGIANNCPHQDIAYFQTWRYVGLGQQISSTSFVGTSTAR
ncbi:glycoside hydrolase family 43 protein [Xylaria sp. FL1042]|nr:glycoside hydrolase family 43 protein [Xylaria sp. FL1042]